MKRIYFLLYILPILFSCEKAIFENELSTTSPKANFEYLWNECNEKYSYFELKNIDWDEVHLKYASLINDNMSDDSLFKVMASMLVDLRDGHTNLISNINVSYFQPEQQRFDNFDWLVVMENYLSDNIYITDPFIHDFIANKQVGYIRLPSFTGGVNNTNLNFILDRYKDTKGLIIDLRENSGGAVSDIFDLLSRFVETKTLVNFSRIKNGPGHNDFSDDEAVYISPSDSLRYTNKVMVLIDRSSYSASSYTALATKAMPNMILVGDTTGGGLGLPNGGQLPNGWSYRFSITQALTLEKDNSYENGVPPDITVLFDWNKRKKDEVIERAIYEILKR